MHLQCYYDYRNSDLIKLYKNPMIILTILEPIDNLSSRSRNNSNDEKSLISI